MTVLFNDYAGEDRTRLVDEVKKIGGTSMHQIKVQISDKTGHSQKLLNPAETVEIIQGNSSGSWVYVDGTMVTPGQVDEASLSSAENVRIVSPLVGGQ